VNEITSKIKQPLKMAIHNQERGNQTARSDVTLVIRGMKRTTSKKKRIGRDYQGERKRKEK
jgi:hypothetical protein